MTTMKKMVAAFTGIFAVLLVTSATAMAVPSYDYSVYSLRGGGTLAPDNDVKENWDWLENNLGWDVVSSEDAGGYTTSTVRYVYWYYHRANGSSHLATFFTTGSGSSYGDAVITR